MTSNDILAIEELKKEAKRLYVVLSTYLQKYGVYGLPRKGEVPDFWADLEAVKALRDWQHVVQQTHRKQILQVGLLREHHLNYVHNYYASHKEKWQDYRNAHLEERKTYCNAYYEKHKDVLGPKSIEYSRKWRQEHPEQENENHRNWRHEHPEEYSAYRHSIKDKVRIYVERHRVALANAEGDFDYEDYMLLYDLQEGRCAYCNRHESETGTLEIEHTTPISRGGMHDISNIVLACRGCNSSKESKTLEEYLVTTDEIVKLRVSEVLGLREALLDEICEESK